MSLGRYSTKWPDRAGWICLLVFSCASLSRGQDSSFSKTDHGIDVAVGKAVDKLGVATPTALGLSISYQGKPVASPSTFLDPKTKNDNTPWQIVHQDSLVGI